MDPESPPPGPSTARGRTGIAALGDAVVERAASLVLDRPFWLVIAVLTLVRFVKAPVEAWNLLDHELMLARTLPHLPHFARDDWFLMTSPTGPVLAHMLCFVSERMYLALHVNIIASGLIFLLIATFRQRGERAARLVALMLVASDVSIFLGNTIGGYDPFTFIASSFLVLASTPLAVVVCSAALGLFHFEQGLLIAVALFIVGPKRSIGRKQQAILTFGGLLVGKLALTVFLAAIGAPLNPRITYAGEEFFITLGMAIQFFPAMVYAAMGPAWVWLVALMWKVGPRWGQVRRGFFALAFLSVPMMVTMDETRVYALLSWPVLMTLMLVAERRASEANLRLLVGVTAIAMIVLPSGWVWLGSVGFPDFASTKGMEIAAARVFGLLLLLLLPPKRRASAALDGPTGDATAQTLAEPAS